MDRGIQTDVMFERGKIDEDSVQGECGHAVADRFLCSRARLEEEPHVNPSTGTLEFVLRDPDGYYVMISALSAG